jgi:putative transposase
VARQLRVNAPDAVHHVTARGNRRALIFYDDADKEGFLTTLGRIVKRYRWICHAYCLMPNHYHLLLETPAPTLSAGMALLNGTYASRFNRRHQLIGHVFQGRFHGVLVEREAHLLELARYVVQNPVRAGLCDRADAWPWSSHGALMRMRPPPFLETGWLLAQFGRGPRAVARYAEFVAEGMSESPWAHLLGGLYLGSPEFAARHAPGKIVRGVPRASWSPTRPSLAELLPTGAASEIRTAVVEHGYRVREVAEQLGVHPATAGRRLARAESSDVSDRTT